MQKYRLLISYDGTPFGGWQVQPNSSSIQGLIEKALQTILREDRLSVVGAGRTDAGVHAKEQVAHFACDKSFDLKRLLFSFNALLPPEVRILEVAPAPEDFHARYSATGKIYHYHLHLARVANPFTRLYTTYFPFPLSLSLVEKALPFFIGTHDFTSFACEVPEKGGIRTLFRLEMYAEREGIRLEFEGNGFLYKMVRNIVGTLLDVGTGKIFLDKIPEIFEAKNRQRAGRCAPPQGLCLMKVFYSISQFAGMDSKESKWEMASAGLK